MIESLSMKKISLEKLHRLVLDNGIAFASYSLPQSQDVVTLVQWNSDPVTISGLDTVKGRSGFVVAPFDQGSDNPVWFLQPDLIVEAELFSQPDNPPLSGENAIEFSNNSRYPSYADTTNYVTDKAEFMLQVDEAKQIIRDQSVEKLVISRVWRDRKPARFDPTIFFKALVEKYPDAFVFLFSIPNAGIWAGASPEPLLTIHDQEASTVSLAGTRVASDSMAEESPWGEKELEEQDIVTRFIQKAIADAGICEVEINGPVTQRAGGVEHLKTSFLFPASEVKPILSSFIQSLHPTPSVCGLPLKLSQQFIKSLERHRREYYTGFLGPVKSNGDLDLYVNLRSMKILSNEIEYYMGAGITAGSDPEMEWEETNNKMNTLKSIVQSLQHT